MCKTIAESIHISNTLISIVWGLSPLDCQYVAIYSYKRKRNFDIAIDNVPHSIVRLRTGYIPCCLVRNILQTRHLQREQRQTRKIGTEIDGFAAICILCINAIETVCQWIVCSSGRVLMCIKLLLPAWTVDRIEYRKHDYQQTIHKEAQNSCCSISTTNKNDSPKPSERVSSDVASTLNDWIPTRIGSECDKWITWYPEAKAT